MNVTVKAEPGGSHQIFLDGISYYCAACSSFVAWFLERWPSGETTLQKAWSALEHPSWMLWFAWCEEFGADVYRLAGRLMDELDVSFTDADEEAPLCGQIRRSLPAAVLEALIAENWPPKRDET